MDAYLLPQFNDISILYGGSDFLDKDTDLFENLLDKVNPASDYTSKLIVEMGDSEELNIHYSDEMTKSSAENIYTSLIKEHQDKHEKKFLIESGISGTGIVLAGHTYGLSLLATAYTAYTSFKRFQMIHRGNLAMQQAEFCASEVIGQIGKAIETSDTIEEAHLHAFEIALSHNLNDVAEFYEKAKTPL